MKTQLDAELEHLNNEIIKYESGITDTLAYVKKTFKTATEQFVGIEITSGHHYTRNEATLKDLKRARGMLNNLIQDVVEQEMLNRHRDSLNKVEADILEELADN